ncbi:disintegrin and metalloproteinase domain-containing protein 10-like [Haliotis rufescens]|uniref:disintegrin and metalloproteinase domain-containing protein 10-like n=1 Tax=Haliotis rufescens TaxID=6454 RepID=UPI00201F4CEA|nr:disintegrin and metalloproteinase domain-containing protein 10-like [Haliotis rufescens]
MAVLPIFLFFNFVICLITCTTPDKEQTSNSCFTARASVNIMQHRKKAFDEYQEVGKVLISVIPTKFEDIHTYVRKLYFRSFGETFHLILRRYSIFHRDMQLLAGSEQPIEVNAMKNYLPIIYVGLSSHADTSPAYISLGKLVGKEFELFIHTGNMSYSLECYLKDNDNILYSTYGFMQHTMDKCRVYRWHNPKMSKVMRGVDSCDLKSRKFKDFRYKTMPENTEYAPQKGLHGGQAERSSTPPTGNCVIKLVADHLYFKHVGKGDVRKTIAEMAVSLAEADMMFRQTDFDGDGVGDNIGFKVGNITIYKEYQEYSLKDENMDVYTYLDRFSEYDFSDYCLGVAYTYRDFEDNIVGLAWIGSSNANGAAGGICQRRIWYRPDKKYYSFNTALVTQLNNGNMISSYSAGLILAHEFGHSFGSSHDPKGNSSCSPGGHFGNYLMYPYTSDGNLANHRRLSFCSINSIFPVLVKKSVGCFKADLGPVCGNSLVEDSEECDCGVSDDVCQDIDPCCTPQHPSISTSDPPCRVRNSWGYQCSPKVSPCCTANCKYVSSQGSTVCQHATECQLAATCQPGNGTCPSPTHQPDGTLCDAGRRLCRGGRCQDSVCVSLGLQECQCSRSLRDACFVCCIATNISSCDCSPISTYQSDKTHLFRHKGDPCFKYEGFCDEAGQCILSSRSIYDDLNKLFAEETVVNVGIWFGKYWYYIIMGILIATALAVIVSLFFKQKPDEHTEAMRIGKLTSALAHVEQMKTMFEEKLEDCEEIFESVSSQLPWQQMSLTEAVARLTVLFPTAPLSLLIKTAKSSSSEDFAVKMLLVRNFPVQRFSVTWPSEEAKSLTLIRSKHAVSA